MATYTVTTNAKEEAVIAWDLARRNAERAAEIPPKAPWTAADYVDTILVRRNLKSRQSQMEQDDAARVATAYAAATNATQTTVKTALGL